MEKFLLKDYEQILLKLILLKVYEQKLLELMGKSF
jgi:hypothetical protein